jgi:DMSO reductase anchor subunit
MLPARDLFAVLAVVFAIAAGWRWLRSGRRGGPAVRTWLIIALIFGAVALWLRFA